MRTKLRSKVTLLFMTFALLLAFPAIALADNVQDDVVVGGNDTITAGGSTTINYHIVSNGSDGCNVDSSNAGTITINTPTGVSSNKSSLSFTACGSANSQSVTYTSNVVSATGHLINVSASGGKAGNNGWNVNPAQFRLIVNPSPNTAPELTLPANKTVEATSSAGAVVNFSADVSASDTQDGDLTSAVECSPASGSTFPLGTTTVNCSVEDSGGLMDNGSFDVTVVDTTPPVISGMPSNISLTATSSSGAVASWTAPTASDLVDGTVPVNCASASDLVSGSTFPLGTTTVNCTATDAALNQAQQSFTVNVTVGVLGILQPINGGLTLGDHSDDNSAFKTGSTVPVKFQLSGASAGIQNATVNLRITKVSNGVLDGAELEALTSTPASTGSLFRYDATSGQYIYNWGTKGYAAGTYQLRLDFGDGNGSHTVWISLRK